jgi:flagellar motor switch protein FliM
LSATKQENPVSAPSSGPTVHPCNFRSAGRLSNESARTLTSLHELVARYLTNSLDVYLGTGLEVRFASVEQLTMDEFKMACVSGGYMLPCATKSSSNTVLLEIDNPLMFTMTDLLLGGTGEMVEVVREVTEIDEDIMEGVGTLIAAEIERVWQAAGYSLTPGKCIKPNYAHRIFPQTEKVLHIKFDVHVANMTGTLAMAFPASLGGSLVRSTRADYANGKGSSFEPLPDLRKRILNCKFSLAGELTGLRVPVRNVAAIEVGSVLLLSAAVSDPAKVMLEGKGYYEALPVRQGNNKAMQLGRRIPTGLQETEKIEELNHAGH